MSGSIVIGLGYGDEGKGLTTSFVCDKTDNPLVVRFNGGHQAGHTVVCNGKRHVFSSFGSGTLQGVPTYWSSYCTFYPPSFLREYNLLDNPTIYVNPLCPVTTPFDIDYNRDTETVNRHGSVGMGFGATLQRQENHYKLFAQDLYYDTVLIAKLRLIANYYKSVDVEEQIEYFLSSVKRVREIIQLTDDSVMTRYNPIFEGAQGVLLDADFGFFPNVTRSNTTTKNALTLYPAQEVYYVTRSYLTRHGNGFMPNERTLNLINNENETNRSHKYQGEFRTGVLSPELLNYALTCDGNYSSGLKKNLVITCMDQYEIDVDALLGQLNTEFSNVYLSYGDSFTDIVTYKGEAVENFFEAVESL